MFPVNLQFPAKVSPTMFYHENAFREFEIAELASATTSAVLPF